MPQRPFLVAARSVIRRGPVVLGFALVVPIVAAGCSRTSAAPARRGGEGGPVPVVTAPVTEKDVPVDIAAIGNVEAYDTVTVRSQVTGQLVDVLFHEGDFVTKGQHLFTIDPRPFEAALAQAQANLVARRGAAGAGRGAARRATPRRPSTSSSPPSATPSSQKRGIISKDMAEQTRAGADATAALVKADKAGARRARRRSSRRSRRPSTTRRCSSATPSSVRRSTDARGNLARQGRQPGHGERQPADHDCRRSSRSTSRSRCRPCTCRRSSSTWARASCRSRRRRRTPTRRPADGHAHLRRQRGRSDDRHDQAEGDVRQPRPAALAGTVRARRACG